MLRTDICVYQGAPPFGGTQSRCVIFWLVHPCHLYLPRCLTFWHHPVKMPHLWAGSSLTNCHLCLPRCLTFRRHPVKMSHLWAGSSLTNCHLCLPRCLTFQRHPVKMPHLLAGSSLTNCHLCLPRCLTFWRHPVKMPHLLAGSSLTNSSVFAKVSHLSAAPSQDASSLGWFIPYQLSSVFAKVSHLSAAHSIFRLFPYMCVNVCIYKFLDILMEFVGPQASCIYFHLPVCVCVYYNHLSVCFDPTR